MVKRFDEQVWDVLETELRAHELERVRSAAGLFYRVPPRFVFDQPDRVEVVLQQAAAAGPEALEIAAGCSA